MSNLRQKKRETVPEEDIEALICPNDEGAPTPTTLSNPVTAKHLQHNLFFIARLVLRKVGELITSNDKDAQDTTRSGGIVGLLKDIVISIVLGLVGVLILVYLNHKDLIHLQSAHGYRNIGFQMMRDPKTRKNVD